jgi:hypothetical protein
MACRQVVVDHANRLHEGIDDGWTDEFEAACGKLFRHFARELGLCRDLAGTFECILLWFAVEEVPQEIRKSRAVLHDVEIASRR